MVGEAACWAELPPVASLPLPGETVSELNQENQPVSAGECGLRTAWHVGRKLIYQVSEEAWFVTEDTLVFPSLIDIDRDSG